MKFILFEKLLTEGKNIDKTWDQYKDRIMSKMNQNPYLSQAQVQSSASAEDVAKKTWLKFISQDPTMKDDSGTTGDYGVWLTNRYLDDQLSLYPKTEVTDLLNEFTKKKPNLEKKDINQYKNIEELKQVLADTKFSKKQKQRQLQNSVNVDGADLLFTGDDWLVYTPNTYAASCFLRKGASWCTGSTESDQWYKYYTSQGKLYIIINRDNPREKYQAFIQDDKKAVKEFRDANNKAISFSKFLRDNLELKECFYGQGILNAPKDTGALANADYDTEILLLADYLDIPPESIIDEGNHRYSTEDSERYWVGLEDDAFEEAVDDEANLLETDTAIAAEFARRPDSQMWRWILDAVDEDAVQDWLNQDFIDMARDTYSTEELVEMGENEDVISPNFNYTPDGRMKRSLFFDPETDELLDDDTVEDNLDDLIYNLAEARTDDDPVGQFINWYSGRDLVEWFSEHINWRSVAENLVNCDGAGNTLAYYDGQEIELPNGYVAYRQD